MVQGCRTARHNHARSKQGCVAASRGKLRGGGTHQAPVGLRGGERAAAAARAGLLWRLAAAGDSCRLALALLRRPGLPAAVRTICAVLQGRQGRQLQGRQRVAQGQLHVVADCAVQGGVGGPPVLQPLHRDAGTLVGEGPLHTAIGSQDCQAWRNNKQRPCTRSCWRQQLRGDGAGGVAGGWAGLDTPASLICSFHGLLVQSQQHPTSAPPSGFLEPHGPARGLGTAPGRSMSPGPFGTPCMPLGVLIKSTELLDDGNWPRDGGADMGCMSRGQHPRPGVACFERSPL